VRRRLSGVVRTGLLASLVAVVATTTAAGFATAVGVELEVPVDGETIPLSGIAFVTGVFSLVGMVIAAALLRWSARPRRNFVRTTLVLTALSLVPPWVVGAAVSTSVTLVVLHLVAAGVVIRSLARSLDDVSVGPGPPHRAPTHSSAAIRSRAHVEGRVPRRRGRPGFPNHALSLIHISEPTRPY